MLTVPESVGVTDTAPGTERCSEDVTEQGGPGNAGLRLCHQPVC